MNEGLSGLETNTGTSSDPIPTDKLTHVNACPNQRNAACDSALTFAPPLVEQPIRLLKQYFSDLSTSIDSGPSRAY